MTDNSEFCINKYGYHIYKTHLKPMLKGQNRTTINNILFLLNFAQQSASQLAEVVLPKASLPPSIIFTFHLLEFPPPGNQVDQLRSNKSRLLVELPPDDISNKKHGPDILENKDLGLEVRNKRIIACDLSVSMQFWSLG